MLREVRLHSDLRLFVVGALPLLTTYCPYRARYFLNPGHWGDPGCRSPSACFTLG
nr:MAG TPA: hypothetical protein [Caudoviricetes sp.]